MSASVAASANSTATLSRGPRSMPCRACLFDALFARAPRLVRSRLPSGARGIRAAHFDAPIRASFVRRKQMLLRYLSAAALAVVIPATAHAGPRCDQILKHIGDELADVVCFESTDLTTNNPLTTPANNSIAGAAGLRVHAADRSRRRSLRARRSARRSPRWCRACRSRRASRPIRGAGAVPPAAARRLERPPRRRRGVRQRAASSTAISPGATTSCRRVMPTRRRTRAC